MAGLLTYTLSLRDGMSRHLKAIGISSDGALTRFAGLEKKVQGANKTMREMGSTIGSLRERLDALRAEREWIPESNLRAIRAYNREIEELENRIGKLDGTKKKSNWFVGLVGGVAGGTLLAGGIAGIADGLLSAFTNVVGMGLRFDDEMGKINSTAQMSAGELATLKKQLIDIGSANGADMNIVPTAFESILSVLGDVNPSLEVFKTSLKGVKATGAELDVISKALVTSKSIIADANVSADDVLNTFLAAKRVGAGEFSDFAQYMPGLIASAKNVGINWKQTAGIFSYMTTKVASAADATMLMQNAFTAMGKGDIQEALSSAGVNLFDKKGMIRSMDQIMFDLANRVQGMSDKAKSNFFEGIELKDAQAKQAFAVLLSDAESLKNIVGDVGNAFGEIDSAINFSKNNLTTWRDIWAKIQGQALKIGGMMAPVVGKALFAFDKIVDKLPVVISALQPLFDMMAAFPFDTMVDGLMSVVRPIISLLIPTMKVGWGIFANLWAALTPILKALEPLLMAVAIAAGIILVPIGELVNKLMNGVSPALTNIARMLSAVLAPVLIGVGNLVGWLVDKFGWLLKPIFKIIEGIAWIFDKYSALYEWLGEKLGYDSGKYTADSWMQGFDGGFNTEAITELMADPATSSMIPNVYSKAGANNAGMYTGGFNNFFAPNALRNPIAAAISDPSLTNMYAAAGASHANAYMNQFSMLSMLTGRAFVDKKPVDDLTKSLMPAFNKPKAVKAPVFTPNNFAMPGSGKSDKKGGAGSRSKANEAVATGGARNTTIHITIGKQIETLTVQQLGSSKESAEDIRNIIVDEMTRAIQMSQSLA